MTTELRDLRLYRQYVEDNLDRISRDGWTPICFAEFQGSEELTEYLTAIKDVVVTRDHGDNIEILAKFVTVKEAEDFITLRERVDPVGVKAGIYGVDAPEHKLGAPV